MKWIGKLHKIENGYQLQYYQRDDRAYKVMESTPKYERFSTIDEAMNFIKKNGVIPEETDSDNTVSFPCPKCNKENQKSWTIRNQADEFLCPRCGNTA